MPAAVILNNSKVVIVGDKQGADWTWLALIGNPMCGLSKIQSPFKNCLVSCLVCLVR